MKVVREHINESFDNMLSDKINLKPYKELDPGQVLQLRLIYKDKTKDKFLHLTYPNAETKKTLTAILRNEEVVGFFNPVFWNDVWDISPIKIDSDWQGMGIASIVLREFFKDKRGRVWIEKDNTASENAHIRAGFHKSAQQDKSKMFGTMGSYWVNYDDENEDN